MTTTKRTSFPGTVTMRVTAAAIKGGCPIVFSSNPGQTKSATLSNWLSAWGHHLEVVSGGNREPSDFLGLPVETVEGFTGYAALGWAMRLVKAGESGKGPGLFLDELNHASEDTMKAMHRVLEERWVGDTPLPANTAIIAAINPPSVATGAVELPAAVANRMLHLEWVTDFDSWANGLVAGFTDMPVPSMDELAPGGDVPSRLFWSTQVASFLRQVPSMRDATPDDVSACSGPWPSLRSWTKTVDVLANLHPDDADAIAATVKGLVGDAAHRQFREFLRTNRLLDPRAALAHPASVDWARIEPDVVWALGQSVLALSQDDATGATWSKALALALAGSQAGFPDKTWTFARKLLTNIPEGRKIPAAVRDEFADRLAEIGLLRRAA